MEEQTQNPTPQTTDSWRQQNELRPQSETVPIPSAPPSEERREPPEENLVGEAKRKQRKAEQEAAEFRRRVEELEDRDRSELEKAQKRAERAEADRDALEQRTTKLERGGWLRNAAQKARFHDVEDAVVRADLGDIDSERAAERFVKELAKSKAHLVQPEEPVSQTDKLGRVFTGDKRETPTRQRGAEEQIAEQEAAAVMAAIQATRNK
jgi:hypothetical protein